MPSNISSKYSFISKPNDFKFLQFLTRCRTTYLLKKEDMISKFPAPLRALRFTPLQKLFVLASISSYSLIKYLEWVS